MLITARQSPNFNDRRVQSIDMLVLHYTGMESRDAALAWLCDPAAQVSAHYLIDEAGAVYQLVAEEKRAWHAGVSYWAGARDINSHSIGIELVNPGHELGYRNFPELQMKSLAELCLQILARHPIPPQRVLGHSDVAPGRKRDPGELFDWQWLAAQGVGTWPSNSDLSASPVGEGNIPALQQALARFGYKVPQTGIYCAQTRAVVTAFQRHFRPSNVDGVADAQTLAVLQQLLT